MTNTTTKFIQNLQRFRLVTFDVTDTLLRFRHSPAVQYAKTAAEFGIDNINQHQLEKCFRQEFKAMTTSHPNFGYSTPNMNWQQWWIQLVENIFRCVDPKIPSNKLNSIAETLLHIYRTRECWSHIEGGKELVKRIRAAGKYVGVISNFDASLTQVLSAMSLENEFDFILTSYESGVQKPNERIFKIPLERCQVQAEQALHIGNIYEIDYIGARQSGWCSLLVAKNIEKVKQGANAMHVYESIPQMMCALETKDIKW